MNQRNSNPTATLPTVFGAMPGIAPELFWGMGRPMLEAFAELTARSLEKTTAVNAAWTSLVHKRMQQAIDMQGRIAACRTPEELMRTYATWAQIAVEQYQTSFDEMARIGQDMQRETVEAVSESFNGASYPSVRHAA